MKTGIYIDSEGNETEVEFDDLQHELLERIDCYDAVYKAIGHDSVGNRYSAYATFSCGECITLTQTGLIINPLNIRNDENRN